MQPLPPLGGAGGGGSGGVGVFVVAPLPFPSGRVASGWVPALLSVPGGGVDPGLITDGSTGNSVCPVSMGIIPTGAGPGLGIVTTGDGVTLPSVPEPVPGAGAMEGGGAVGASPALPPIPLLLEGGGVTGSMPGGGDPVPPLPVEGCGEGSGPGPGGIDGPGVKFATTSPACGTIAVKRPFMLKTSATLLELVTCQPI